MGGRLHREKLRKNARDLERRFSATKRVCPNCTVDLKGGSGHFVPPSMGERGFFVCLAFKGKK